MRAPRHFLDLDAFEAVTWREILERAGDLKARLAAGERAAPLQGRSLALIFERPSTRTRVSFEVGMRQLGGHTVVLSRSNMQLGRGESIADTARVLSRYVDAIVIRARRHEAMLEFAEYATVPVINGLTDRSHPCQLLADVLTFEEKRGPINGRVFAWSGDGNNMATSWIHAAALLDFELRLACPEARRPAGELLKWAAERGGRITVTEDVKSAVKGADCVVTDTWFSMGHAPDASRRETLAPYRVDERLLALAKPEALFMHCLPAHRGEEVSAGVIDGPQSVVFEQSENRLHAQKAVLATLMK